VIDMMQIRKTLFIGFMVMTIISILFFSYTMYLVFGAAKAVRSLTVSISEIEIDEDSSEASFLLLIYNPSNIHLGLYRYEVEFHFLNEYIDERISYSHQATPLPSKEGMNLSWTISLTERAEGQDPYSSSGWTLEIEFRFRTPLPLTIVHTEILEK
jgi:hypothetical protein